MPPLLNLILVGKMLMMHLKNSGRISFLLEDQPHALTTSPAEPGSGNRTHLLPLSGLTGEGARELVRVGGEVGFSPDIRPQFLECIVSIYCLKDYRKVVDCTALEIY